MIAIKDMEMPKTCTMCWLSPMCKVHGEKPEYLGYDTRMDGCPLVEIVTCADCKHRPYCDDDGRLDGDYVCPYLCDDPFYSIEPIDNWFCHRGERRDDDHTR